MIATLGHESGTTSLPVSGRGAGRAEGVTEAQRLDARMCAWRPLYRPCTAEEEWLFGLLVTSALRVEDCQAHLVALRDFSAERAGLAWEVDRACEAEDLALKLERKPGATVARLRSFRQGAEVLLGRWKMLQRVLDRGERWDEDQASMALDLLGISPKGRSDAPWDRDPEDAHRIARVEIADLERIIAGHLALLDDFERDAAAEGQPVAVPDAIKALRREESAALRTFQWARQLLLGPDHPAPRTNTRTARTLLADHPTDDLDHPGADDLDDPPLDEDEDPFEDDLPPTDDTSSTPPTPHATSTDPRTNRRARRAARKRQREARRRG